MGFIMLPESPRYGHYPFLQKKGMKMGLWQSGFNGFFESLKTLGGITDLL